MSRFLKNQLGKGVFSFFENQPFFYNMDAYTVTGKPLVCTKVN